MMPINRAFGLGELKNSLRIYQKNTNRRITIEYLLLKAINDSKEDAKNLASLLKGLNCYVNLIPYNEVKEKPYKKSSKEKTLYFYDALKKQGINVTIRRELGSDIDAACGQLKNKKEEH